MSHKFLFVPLAVLLISACQTTGTDQSATEPSSTSGATATAETTGIEHDNALADGAIALQSGDGPALAGVWNGNYRLQNGWTGRTRLDLSPAGPDSVDGVFEYMWRGGGYERVPDSGTTRGRIRPDGTLAFGSFVLRLEKDGSEYRFVAEDRIAGQPAKIDWRRSDVRLADRSTASAVKPQAAPLSATTAIASPNDEVPSQLAAFSGIWAGAWDGTLDGKLAVQSVTPDGSAEGIYSWGDHPSGRFSAGSTEFTGEIQNGVLKLDPLGNGAEVTYEMRSDGSLFGTYILNGSKSTGRFVKL